MKLNKILSKLQAWSDPSMFVIPTKKSQSSALVWGDRSAISQEVFGRCEGDVAIKHIAANFAGLAIEAQCRSLTGLTIHMRRLEINPRQGAPISIELAHISALGGESMWVLKLVMASSVITQVCEAGSAIDKYKELRKNLLSNDDRPARITRVPIYIAGACLAVYLGFAALGAYFDATKHSTVAELNTPLAPVPAIPPLQPMQSQALNTATPTFPSTAYLTEAERASVAAAAAIKVSKSGPALVVFTDPNCPFCQRLEATLGDYDKKAAITLIPVGYKTGSKELAASVLCAKDPVAAWKMAITYGKATGPVCPDGLKQVDRNNELFESLHLTSTPTMVSPKGLMINGALQTAELDTLLQN